VAWGGREVSDRERVAVFLLAVLAALRVFLFASAFPFFTNVDEQKHVDTVMKYARGYLPRPGTDAYERETGHLLAIYGSPEFLLAEADRAETPAPVWKRPSGAMLARIERSERFLAARANKEAYQPPVYYATAGAWMRLGRSLGIEGGYLLYWIRALNPLATFLLVLASALFLRRLAPNDPFLRLGLPALLCVFPQDSVYYVTRDAFSPLLGALCFFFALDMARAPQRSLAYFAGVGALTAAASLAKFTNLAALPVLAVATFFAARSAANPAKRRGLLLMWGVALAPLAFWLIRNQILFGDPTATALKIERLGWGHKPFSEWLDHPLFGFDGIAFFVSELVPTFWRGELAWYQRTLVSPFADRFYQLSTALFLTLAGFGVWRGQDPAQRRLDVCAFLMLATGTAMLGLLSLMYEFTETSNPPASHPFFVQGRLISAAMAPFLLLYLRGIQVATSPLGGLARPVAAWTCVAVVIGVVGASEGLLSAPVFASEYNWFHLP
jgi:hypothetical protein